MRTQGNAAKIKGATEKGLFYRHSDRLGLEGQFFWGVHSGNSQQVELFAPDSSGRTHNFSIDLADLRQEPGG
jgi:hypothetical protein